MKEQPMTTAWEEAPGQYAAIITETTARRETT